MSNDEKTDDATSTRPQYEQRGLGIIGMQKVFKDVHAYSRKLKEELDAGFDYFETLSEMCDLIEEEKKKAIHVILKGNAFRLYVKNKDQVTSYSEGISVLRNWFASKPMFHWSINLVCFSFSPYGLT